MRYFCETIYCTVMYSKWHTVTLKSTLSKSPRIKQIKINYKRKSIDCVVDIFLTRCGFEKSFIMYKVSNVLQNSSVNNDTCNYLNDNICWVYIILFVFLPRFQTKLSLPKCVIHRKKLLESRSLNIECKDMKLKREDEIVILILHRTWLMYTW